MISPKNITVRIWFNSHISSVFCIDYISARQWVAVIVVVATGTWSNYSVDVFGWKLGKRYSIKLVIRRVQEANVTAGGSHSGNRSCSAFQASNFLKSTWISWQPLV